MFDSSEVNDFLFLGDKTICRNFRLEILGTTKGYGLDKLPQWAECIEFGREFNVDLSGELHKLKNLKQLRFGWKYNKPLLGELPEWLESLTFSMGNVYNHSLERLPSSLTELIFFAYCDFNNKLPADRPKHLKYDAFLYLSRFLILPHECSDTLERYKADAPPRVTFLISASHKK